MPASDDHRCMGVAVQALALDSRPLDPARLAAGWHSPEPGLRWTDGAGHIALDGARALRRTLAPLGRYWSPPAALAAWYSRCTTCAARNRETTVIRKITEVWRFDRDHA